MADNTSETKEEAVKLQTQITLMKSSFNASFENLIAVQELHEKMLKDMLKKGMSVKADSVKKVNDFIENAKTERDDYRKVMEDGFKNIEELLITGNEDRPKNMD